MTWLTDYKEHERLSAELFHTDWYKGLMDNEEFKDAFERNYKVRFKLSDTGFVKDLLDSEVARVAFVNNVLHINEES